MNEYNHKDLMELAGYLGMDYEERELFGIRCQDQLVYTELCATPSQQMSVAQFSNKHHLEHVLLGRPDDDDRPSKVIAYRLRTFIVNNLPTLLANERARRTASAQYVIP